MKALEEENAAKVEKEKRRASYLSERAKSLKEERDDAIEKAAEVTSLRRESAKLRENESKRLVELERLQKALEREREASSSSRTPASPSKPARDITDPETVAVDAVLAALSDVLVAECATEVEFELEFGLSEAQLLGLAPLPELPSTVPEEPARNPSLEEQLDASRRNLRRARSASPPARRDATETPATLLRGFGPSPSSGSSKASPTLRDLETTFRSLSSELSPSTAQGVLDGLESPLDGLVR